MGTSYPLGDRLPISSQNLANFNRSVREALGTTGVNNLLPQNEKVTFTTPGLQPSGDTSPQHWRMTRGWDGITVIAALTPEQAESGVAMNPLFELRFQDSGVKNGILDSEDSMVSTTPSLTQQQVEQWLAQLGQMQEVTPYSVEIPQAVADAINEILREAGTDLTQLRNNREFPAIISSTPLSPPEEELQENLAFWPTSGTETDTQFNIVESRNKTDESDYRFYFESYNNIKVADANGNGFVEASVDVQPNDRQDRLRFGLSPQEIDDLLKLLREASGWRPWDLTPESIYNPEPPTD
jgi:hypothetical protein